jgi:leucyl aminopeptidase (aminopeptidase T)
MSWFMELPSAAKKLIKEVLFVQRGEEVVIYGDSITDEAVMKATAAAALEVGANPTVILYETKPDPKTEPPKAVAAAMMTADVLIEYSVQYLLYTKAQVDALNRHNRAYICLTGCDTEALIRTVGWVDYKTMTEMGDVLSELSEQADEIRITTQAGTDITMKRGDRPVPNVGATADRNKYIMLGGQVLWNGLEETINGTLAFDVNLWPPDEIRQNIQTPIKLDVEKGVIKNISGGKEANYFAKWMASLKDKNMYRIAHFSYGFNPGARPSGNIAEVERVFGVVQVGWGTQGPLIRPDLKGEYGWIAASHCDGIMGNPSVYLDGKAIEENGKYVHPELAKLTKKLGVEQ